MDFGFGGFRVPGFGFGIGCLSDEEKRGQGKSEKEDQAHGNLFFIAAQD